MPTPPHGKRNRYTWWTEPQALATTFWALSQAAVKSQDPTCSPGKACGPSDPNLLAHPLCHPRALSPPVTGRVLALSQLMSN